MVVGIVGHCRRCRRDKHYFAAEWCDTGRKQCDSQRSRRFGLSALHTRNQKEFYDVSPWFPWWHSILEICWWGAMFVLQCSSFVCARLSWFLHISALGAKDRPCAVQWCWSWLLEGSQNERVVGLSLLASSTARVSLGHPQSASIKMFSLCKAKRFWMHKVLRAVLQEFQSIAQLLPNISCDWEETKVFGCGCCSIGISKLCFRHRFFFSLQRCQLRPQWNKLLWILQDKLYIDSEFLRDW